MKVQSYLFFDGRCEEALNFYREVFGAELMMLRYKESPDPSMRKPETDEKIMHASFRIGETEIMASDGMCQGNLNFQGFSLTVTLADAKKADDLFAALSQGGKVQMPLMETFFSPKFGMVADRFGVSWMIMLPPK